MGAKWQVRVASQQEKVKFFRIKDNTKQVNEMTQHLFRVMMKKSL